MSNDITKKPPLGAMPEWLYREQRLRELAIAIHKSVCDGFFDSPVPEWCDELSRRLRDIKKEDKP